MIVNQVSGRRLWQGAVLFVFLLVFGFWFKTEKEPLLKSHLTLYVQEPLLSQGGTIIVASIPLSLEEWAALDGINPATDDTLNRKRSSLQPDDVLFGALVAGRATIVEMYYPEGGTFGFDLVADPRIQNPPPLTTERLGVGSGGWTHWSSGTDHIWPDFSAIYVAGASASEGQTRTVIASVNRIMNLPLNPARYAGAIVYTPTSDQISAVTNGEVQ
jgi:hypothetical protein